MKISFCQTYGNDRKQLLEIKFRDKKFHQLLKFFDINIFSFHNCSEELINWFKQNNNIPNLKIFINNNITYTQCIKRLLNVVDTLKGNFFLFHQDDTFSFDNDNVVIEDLLHFLFLEKDIMLNLMFQKDEFQNLKSYKHLKTIELFENNSQNFAKHKKWAFDDSPYICTTNYLPIIYDNNYLQYTDIWSAEHYLNHKFQQIDIKRFVTNKCLFKNYNFLGPNNWNQEYEIRTLTQKQLILA